MFGGSPPRPCGSHARFFALVIAVLAAGCAHRGSASLAEQQDDLADQCRDGSGLSCLAALAALRSTHPDERNQHEVAELVAVSSDLFGFPCPGGPTESCPQWRAAQQLSHKLQEREQAAMGVAQAAVDLCLEGSTVACLAALQFMLAGNDNRSQETALKLSRRACELGDATMCNMASQLVIQGDSTDADEVSAQLAQRACEGGVAEGCASLGIAYRDGRGVVEDSDLAQRLLRRACKEEDTHACYSFGAHLERTTDQDGERGEDIAWAYHRACALGGPKDCTEWGRVLVAGLGVKQDAERGRALLERACEQEEMRACTIFGLMLKSGRGGPVETERADRVLHRACVAGQSEACF